MSDLTELVNQYIVWRDQRLELERRAQSFKEKEDEVKLALIAAMREQKLESARTSVGMVTYKSKPMPVAKNWPDVYEYIKENNAFDLLQRRLHEGAVQLRLDDGIKIPGIEFFPVDKITVSK